MASKEARPDGRQLRWDRHNRERREQIIAAAIAEIESVEPGAEVHVRAIAERAGVGRSVVYRYFDDRADLDRAVQAQIVDDLSEALLEVVTLDGTIPEIVRRVVGRYVEWAVAHPSLHRVAEQDTGADNALQAGLSRIAAQVVDLISYALGMLAVDLSEDERAALDPLVFGLVGAVFGAVRRWLGLPVRAPSAPVVVGLVTESVWFLIDGHSRSLGLTLDRDQPVEQLLATPGDAPVEA